MKQGFIFRNGKVEQVNLPTKAMPKELYFFVVYTKKGKYNFKKVQAYTESDCAVNFFEWAKATYPNEVGEIVIQQMFIECEVSNEKA